jgi:hypothetical protein
VILRKFNLAIVDYTRLLLCECNLDTRNSVADAHDVGIDPPASLLFEQCITEEVRQRLPEAIPIKNVILGKYFLCISKNSPTRDPGAIV